MKKDVLKLSYPDNLVAVILGFYQEYFYTEYKKPPKYEETVEKMIECMKGPDERINRYLKLINLRYKQHLTYREIALQIKPQDYNDNHTHISRPMVQHHLAMCIRALRRIQNNTNILNIGLDEYQNNLKANAYLFEQNIIRNKRTIPPVLGDMSVDRILSSGLPRRVSRTLYHRHFNIIQDVAKLSKNDLSHIPGIGKKSIDEIVKYIKTVYNFDIPES